MNGFVGWQISQRTTELRNSNVNINERQRKTEQLYSISMNRSQLMLIWLYRGGYREECASQWTTHTHTFYLRHATINRYSENSIMRASHIVSFSSLWLLSFRSFRLMSNGAFSSRNSRKHLFSFPSMPFYFRFDRPSAGLLCRRYIQLKRKQNTIDYMSIWIGGNWAKMRRTHSTHKQ